MSVKTYSVKKQGSVKLSTNFTVKEFACKDGSDTVLIDDELVTLLQKIRTYFNKSLTITSGYRTSSYNAKIGGASGSVHVKGQAADIKISGVDPIKIALYADSILGSKGGVELGSYGTDKSGYVHVDVRTSKWRAIRPTSANSYVSYSSMTPTIKTGTVGPAVTIVTRKLKQLGYLTTVSSTCTATVVAGIKKFQTAKKLTADGVFGSQSWKKLGESI
jgi:hypothetical protein